MNLKSPREQEYIQQLSIDCVIFGYEDEQLKVLIPKLDFTGDFWALPAGFIQQEEDIDEAARRILAERTGLADIYLEQFRVFGTAKRSNKTFMERLVALNPTKLDDWGLDLNTLGWLTRRFVSIGYYALVDIHKVNLQKGNIDASIQWYPIRELPSLIMDHEEMIHIALDTLRLNLDQKLIAYNLLPETFTIKEVQELYEAIYERPFARNNFQKKILDQQVLERLEKKFTGAANKAPYVYRWKRY